MDYVSHGAWSYIFFNRIKRPFLAVLFGLLPDTLSWGIYAFYKLITGGAFGKPIISEIPRWVFELYNISHSLVVAAVVIFIVFTIMRRIPLYILAWPIAIVMDLLTHTRDFLPTPFLWPISDWTFPGISWGSKSFMTINYSLIIIITTIIVFRKIYWKNR